MKNVYENYGYNVTELKRISNQPLSTGISRNTNLSKKHNPILFQVGTIIQDNITGDYFSSYVKFTNFTGNSVYNCQYRGSPDNYYSWVNMTYDPINGYNMTCYDSGSSVLIINDQNPQVYPGRTCYAPISIIDNVEFTCDIYDCSGLSTFFFTYYIAQYGGFSNPYVIMLDRCPVANTCSSNCNYFNQTFDYVPTMEAVSTVSVNTSANLSPISSQGSECYLFGTYNTTSLNSTAFPVTYLQTVYSISNTTSTSITFCDGIINYDINNNTESCTLYTTGNETSYFMNCCFSNYTETDSSTLIIAKVSNVSGSSQINYCPPGIDCHFSFSMPYSGSSSQTFFFQNATLSNVSSNSFISSCQINGTFLGSPFTISFTIDSNGNFTITNCPLDSLSFGCGSTLPSIENLVASCSLNITTVFDNPVMTLFVFSNAQIYSHSSNFTCPSVPSPTTVIPTTLTPSTFTPSTFTPSTFTPSTVIPSTVIPSTLIPSTLIPSTLIPSTLIPSTLIPSTLTPSIQQFSTQIPTSIPSSPPSYSTIQPTEAPTEAPTEDWFEITDYFNEVINEDYNKIATFYCSGTAINYSPECDSEIDPCCSVDCKINKKGSICGINQINGHILFCDGQSSQCKDIGETNLNIQTNSIIQSWKLYLKSSLEQNTNKK